MWDVVWKSPLEGHLKLNMDGAIFEYLGVVGFGVTCGTVQEMFLLPSQSFFDINSICS